jgi:hypothetical protein
VPLPATLKRHGLTAKDWLAMHKRQRGRCAVCRIRPNGRLCIDHEHVKGWKKLPRHERKQHVRGLLCYFCNHYYVGRGITIFKARNVVKYLERHEAKKRS